MQMFRHILFDAAQSQCCENLSTDLSGMPFFRLSVLLTFSKEVIFIVLAFAERRNCISDSFGENELASLELNLEQHHDFVCKAYGASFLTSNFHKLLHLPQLIRNHGTLHDFSVRNAFRHEMISISLFIAVCSLRACTESNEPMEIAGKKFGPFSSRAELESHRIKDQKGQHRSKVVFVSLLLLSV